MADSWNMGSLIGVLFIWCPILCYSPRDQDKRCSCPGGYGKLQLVGGGRGKLWRGGGRGSGCGEVQCGDIGGEVVHKHDALFPVHVQFLDETKPVDDQPWTKPGVVWSGGS